MVHVGVSNCAQKLTLETQAFRTGYSKRDCMGNFHPTGQTCSAKDSSDCLTSQLNMQSICDYVNNSDVKACISDDAGR